MRVSALVHFYVPNHMAGSETMLHTMLRALVDAGHEVDVITTMEAGPGWAIDGVNVHPAETRMMARSMLADLVPDVVVSHHYEAKHAVRWCELTGIPVVQIVHNTFAEHLTNVESAGPGLTVFNTHWVRTYFAEHGVVPARSMVLHPPIDSKPHKTTPGTMVTLVNLNANKGSGLFYKLAEAMPETNFLGVVGAYGDQDIREMPNVTVHPHTSDPRDFWSQTRILLIPSVYESYGMVGIEAALSGIPSIAAPTPGLLESLGDAAVFADTRYLSEWINALNKLQRPAKWGAASRDALARAGSLTPSDDLAAWVATVEEIVCSPSRLWRTQPALLRR